MSDQVGAAVAAGDGCSQTSAGSSMEPASHLSALSSTTDVPLEARPDVVRWGSGEIRAEEAFIADPHDRRTRQCEVGKRLRIVLRFRVLRTLSTQGLSFAFALRNRKGLDVLGAASYDEGRREQPPRRGDTYAVTFEFDNILAPGDYSLIVAVEDRSDAAPRYYDFVENAAILTVTSHKRIFWETAPPIFHRVERIAPDSVDDA